MSHDCMVPGCYYNNQLFLYGCVSKFIWCKTCCHGYFFTSITKSETSTGHVAWSTLLITWNQINYNSFGLPVAWRYRKPFSLNIPKIGKVMQVNTILVIKVETPPVRWLLLINGCYVWIYIVIILPNMKLIQLSFGKCHPINSLHDDFQCLPMFVVYSR